METILEDKTKFGLIGDATGVDKTDQQEPSLQAFLMRAQRNRDITKQVYDRNRPVGSTRPRMYVVPKVHKPQVPLRLILSMINAPEHQMAKWLTEVLQPVLH